MQDYKLFAALTAVVDTGSFERAAGKLFITPSAVSQRIRQLEERMSQTLVIRSSPTIATSTGMRLGEMRYRCIATPAFAARYFPHGMGRDAVLRAPAITFGSSDTLHTNFLASRFAVAAGEFPLMTVPSVQSLLDCIRGGLGYGICPELQWEEMLADGALVDLMPADRPAVQLHWHAWELQSPRVGRFIDHMVEQARIRLPQ